MNHFVVDFIISDMKLFEERDPFYLRQFVCEVDEKNKIDFDGKRITFASLFERISTIFELEVLKLFRVPQGIH